MLIEFSNLDILNYLSLASHLSTAIKSINLITKLELEIELKEQNEMRLFQLAQFDPLTNLYNRTSFQGILNQLASEKKPFILINMDIDGFKSVNDEYGHGVGDILLIEIANRIRLLLEGIAILPLNFSDVMTARQAIFRLGGDEFTAIIDNLCRESLADLADKVNLSFREPFSIQEYEISIGISIGISQFPKDTDELKTLIKYADNSMYQAKKRRNSYTIFGAGGE